MTAFLWTVLVLHVISTFTNLNHLATGKPEKPTTPKVRVFGVVANVGFMFWIAYLLIR